MGLINKLKKNYDITDEWISFEIHPETPLEGVNLEDRFGKARLESSIGFLSQRAKELDLGFGMLTHMPNSSLAHQLTYYARDKGLFPEAHRAIMEAYYKDSRDIGSIDVLTEIASDIGLNGIEVKGILESSKYLDDVNSSSRKAISQGISSTPTFIINDKHTISGAQPLETFINIIEQELK